MSNGNRTDRNTVQGVIMRENFKSTKRVALGGCDYCTARSPITDQLCHNKSENLSIGIFIRVF